MLEQNIAHRSPEIPPIRGKGTLLIGFDISLLRCLDILDRLGGNGIVIERR